MARQPLANQVAARLHQAAARLHTADPSETLNGMLKRTFVLPEGDPRYARNALTPGAAPIEPSLSAAQAPTSFASTSSRSGPKRQPSTAATKRRARCAGWSARLRPRRAALVRRAQRSLARFRIGREPQLRRLLRHQPRPRRPLQLEGLLREWAGQLDSLPMSLVPVVSTALSLMPALRPLFTTIAAQRDFGTQRLTFAHPPALRLADLQPLLDALGLGARMPASCRSSA